nr:metal ABC transporter permease [uncultured Cohaesibacter sp.]
MVDFLSLGFVQHALWACLFASITCGVVGTFILLNRLVFLAGGTAHAAYGGIGLAICFQLPILPSLLAFSCLTSLVMGSLSIQKTDRTEVLTGALWAVGMAVGILALDFTEGYNVDLMSYLFGSILAVSNQDLTIMGAIVVAIVAVVVWRYDDFLLVSFDRPYARTRNVPVSIIYFLLLIITALATVLLIRVVGIILTIALLTIPPFIGMRYANRLWKMMLIGTGCSLFFSVGGLLIAYYFNLTASAAIIMLAAVTLAVVLSEEAFMVWRRKKQILSQLSSQ